MAVSSDQGKIKVCFEGAGQRLFFSIKRSAKLKKAMGMFCKSAGIPTAEAIFNLDGQTVRETSTPNDINLSDSDVIDVSFKHDGGSSYSL